MRNARVTVGWLCACVVAAWTGAVGAQGALVAPGVRESDMKQALMSWLETGQFNLASFRVAFKAAAPAARPDLTKAVLTWARQYTATPAFKTDYDRRRAATAPSAPKAGNVDAQLAAQKAEQDKAIAEMKKNLASLPAEIRPQMEATIKQMEADAAKRNADPRLAGVMRQGLEMQSQEDQRTYQEAVARHEKRFPADPRVLLASRLREFLAVSQSVDYGARLVNANGRMRFENPAYEKQSNEWKLFYRAGRESMEAARQQAQAWLESLK